MQSPALQVITWTCAQAFHVPRVLYRNLKRTNRMWIAVQDYRSYEVM
jgi:hypothetical protein